MAMARSLLAQHLHHSPESNNVERKAGIMPLVTVNTGFTGPDGEEEQLTEYFCDSSDCPNIAVRVVRFVSEIGECLFLCEKHAAKLRLKA